MRSDYWLLTGGVLSLVAAAVHVTCIFGGPDWYRFFGAGEGMARAAEAGRALPAVLTLCIAAMLSLWGAYALSGAGLIPRLPLLRTGLVIITVVYLARGLIILYPPAFGRSDLSWNFMLWSSLIVLAFGIVHAIGLWRAWPLLARV